MDYVDMSSLSTSSSSAGSGAGAGAGRHRRYSARPAPPPAGPRSRSVSRPSPPRPPRTHSFTSLYSRGTSLDLRPLRASISSQGIFAGSEGGAGPVSLSLQDLQSVSHYRGSYLGQKLGRSLLDLSHVTINDSEIDKDEALLIISIARQAVEQSDLTAPGCHGRVAGLVKDRLEGELGRGGWQCVVGRKGQFGCCLSPAPHNYFNFDLAQVTVLMFKAN